MDATLLLFLEEIVVPLSLLGVGTIPGLLAVLLDVVKDELATGVGEGAALAGLVVAAAATAATAVVVVIVVVIVIVVSILRSGTFRGSGAGRLVIIIWKD